MSRFTSSSTCQPISLIIPALVIHHFFTRSLQAQKLPFQQILPTLDFFYLLDCFRDNKTGPTGPITLIGLFFVSHFNVLFIPCGRLSWLVLPVSLYCTLNTHYRIGSYRIVCCFKAPCVFVACVGIALFRQVCYLLCPRRMCREGGGGVRDKKFIFICSVFKVHEYLCSVQVREPQNIKGVGPQKSCFGGLKIANAGTARPRSQSTLLGWQREAVCRRSWHSRPHYLVPRGSYHATHCLGNTPPSARCPPFSRSRPIFLIVIN